MFLFAKLLNSHNAKNDPKEKKIKLQMASYATYASRRGSLSFAGPKGSTPGIKYLTHEILEFGQVLKEFACDTSCS